MVRNSVPVINEFLNRAFFNEVSFRLFRAGLVINI